MTKYLKGRSGQKKRVAPAEPFKDGFALQIPNPDFNYLSLDLGLTQSLSDLYSDEYKSALPKVDHTPASYEEILESAKKGKDFDWPADKEIYVWLGQLSGLIKIGHSTNPARRRIQANSSTGETIFGYELLDGDRHIERLIHETLAPFRHHGEWYYPTDQVIEWLYQAEGWGGF